MAVAVNVGVCAGIGGDVVVLLLMSRDDAGDLVVALRFCFVSGGNRDRTRAELHQQGRGHSCDAVERVRRDEVSWSGERGKGVGVGGERKGKRDGEWRGVWRRWGEVQAGARQKTAERNHRGRDT